ncbi:MAG: RDD family protein [Cyclobacteriaceae bacterium]|nr:RDD family protein [Cyclobacteriaceae bacterium]
MTREEQLEYCKVCQYQKIDASLGIVCKFTNAPAAFEVSCGAFLEDTNSASLYVSASQGKRLANYLIDLVFMIIFGVFFSLFFELTIGVIIPETLWILEEGNLLGDYLFGFMNGMLYYTLFEYYTGRTVAKYITKTKVVDENGEIPDFNMILKRTLCRFIPFEAFSFLGSEVSGWHDTISKTKVVNV